ncbi:beta-lactamase family protein [candidate division KSB1 bacterium]|nr:beta-lactamase family protein [candidate division KSB1 bacterium]
MMKNIVRIGLTICFFLMIGCAKDNVQLSPEQTKINTYVSRLESQGYAGALLVAKGDQIIRSTGFGLANQEKNTRNSSTTVFPIGSVTKQFTAAAIMKLQMQGKLGVNDPILKFIPETSKDKQKITIHQLLTHTAGFAGSMGDDFTPISKEQFVADAMKAPLMEQPGTAFMYSNIGYSLLGVIIENVSGQSYESFLQTYLFKPADMKHTGYIEPDWKSTTVAHGYIGDRDWSTVIDRISENGPSWYLLANGDLNSTVEDMYKWHVALQGNVILSDEAKNAMYTPYMQENMGSASNYGYGWYLFETPRHTPLVAHNGGNKIFSADYMRFIEEDVVVIVFSNVAGKPASNISATVARIVFHEPYDLPLDEAVVLSKSQLVDSPLGVHAIALIDIYGSSDIATAESFITEHISSSIVENFGVPKLRDMLRQDQNGIGDCTFHQARKTSEYTLEIIVQSRKTSKWWQIRLKFDPEPPHKIISIGANDILPPAQ